MADQALLKKFRELVEQHDGVEPSMSDTLNRLIQMKQDLSESGLKAAIEGMNNAISAKEERKAHNKPEGKNISNGEQSNPTGSTTLGVLGGVGRHNAQRGNQANRTTEKQALRELAGERRG